MTLSRPFDVLPLLLEGAAFSFSVMAMAAGLGAVIALLAGLARMSPLRFVRVLATAYVEVFRGTSALVQLFYVFYVLPLFGVSLSPLQSGVLALGLNIGAYGSEVVRGAAQAVDPGQREAAVALNMSNFLYLRRVLLPQAVVAMLPPTGSLLIDLLKGTSLLSLITIRELAFTGKLLLAAGRDPVEIYPIVLLLYFVMASVVAWLVRLLERRASRGLNLGRAL